MINILLAGVGGQGTVLAAKVFAAAAYRKGWKVRSAETIGMAQRGGSVISHVRMGNAGEEVHASLVSLGSADIIVAFEPAEAARVLPYLSETGTIICATTPVQAITSALLGKSYSPTGVLANLRANMGPNQKLLAVNDKVLMSGAVEGKIINRKALNVVLLTAAFRNSDLGLSLEDLRTAIVSCVKPQFVEMNLSAVDAVQQAFEQEIPGTFEWK